MRLRSIGLIVTLTLGLLPPPLVAEAQQAGKVYRVGYLTPFHLPTPGEEALRQGLRDLGYVEGRNIVIEARTAEQQYGELPKLAAQLVAMNVDVIVAATGTTALAVKRVTSTVPIVIASSNDAVLMGIVESLQRPGGNVTGLTGLSAELAPKRLEILKDLLPGLKSVAVLWCPRAPINRVELGHVRTAAKTLRVHVQSVEYNEQPAAWRDTMQTVLWQDRPDALFLLDCTSLPRQATVDFALQHRLPTISHSADVTRQGGLLSYGPDWLEMIRRRAAVFVDKILKGAKPADLPVEQPTKFALVVNLKTAKALGLTIPPSILIRADEVIQ